MSTSPALKDLINEASLRAVAAQFATATPGFRRQAFLSTALDGLEALSVMQRVHRIAQSLHAALPGAYGAQLEQIVAVAPQLDGAFVNMGLNDFVAHYGQDDFGPSMAALKTLTRFGTAEFAVRHFLRRDLPRTLAVMRGWAEDGNEHVRRLASEGCRPRLPWSFKLDALVADPSPLAPLLDRLRADDSLYVRRSVANSLNDITKDHPGWVLDHLGSWPLDDARCAWIARHALRSQIKKGNPRALALLGAEAGARVSLQALRLHPPRVVLGGHLDLSFTLQSEAAHAQRLVVDYALHYVKKNGATAPKVFKLRTLTLEAGAAAPLQIRRALRDFSTRVHYPGTHAVEILVNGQALAGAEFELVPVPPA